MQRIAIFLASFAATAAVCGLALKLMILQSGRPKPAEPPAASAPDSTRAAARPAKPRPAFVPIEPGLEFAEFDAPGNADSNDSPTKVRVLRIDTARFDFRLLWAPSGSGPAGHSVAQWCKRDALLAGVNAGQVGRDGRTSLGLMQARGMVNNPRPSRDRALFAFDPLGRDRARAVVADLDHRPVNQMKIAYAALVQGPRIIPRLRSGSPQPAGRASAACVGLDSTDRILFVHVTRPCTAAELNEAVNGLRLGVRVLMLTETGPAAQLAVNVPGHERQFVGRQDPSRADSDSAAPPPVPNVVGVVRRIR